MRPTRKRSSRDARGLRVVGPRFYLWDADPREALRLAAELGGRRKALPFGQRRPPAQQLPVG